MIFYINVFLILFSLIYPQKNSPSHFWKKYNQDQKMAFINGVYGTVSKLKSHHKSEVRKQYMHKKNWIEPYYIERFYEIADEYRANSVGYDLTIIASHMDAFYSNSDNFVNTLSTLLLDKNKLKQLGEKAFDYAQKNHNWNILSKQLLQKFDTVLTQ